MDLQPALTDDETRRALQLVRDGKGHTLHVSVIQKLLDVQLLRTSTEGLQLTYAGTWRLARMKPSERGEMVRL